PELPERYLERVITLHRSFPHPVVCYLYAMDRYYRPDGVVDLNRTPFYVSNDYVFEVAKRWPSLFVPVISVHPHRPDALEELDRWSARGCRFVKWLPNAMGIDPSDARLDPFYRRLRERGMTLLAHTGYERALVVAEHQQALGNPLLLRRPLAAGVRVVALHCASDGLFVDTENARRERKPGVDLLLRLFDEPRYEGLLFGELSATTFFNHLPYPLLRLLERADLHHRLVNGSDYPLPGIRVLIQPSRLARHGFITQEQARHLREIYDYNPLLFDYVVKRTVRHPVTGKRFPPSVFTLRPELDGRLLPSRNTPAFSG
ncbi:MAG: amidohydrolase family protein, partial [Verrucomicrobiae bacterium]|nr:amidohydrolase family protein [Verrucomicrobiae bacterium]